MSTADFARKMGHGEYGPGGAFYQGEKVKKEEENVQEIKKEWEEQKKFECEICGAKFDYKVALVGHSRKHKKSSEALKKGK